MRISVIIFLSLLLLIVAVPVASCAKPPSLQEKGPPLKGGEPSLSVTSPAFADGARIPVKYTCDGQNISPPLEWSQVPAATAAFVLIMDDPDAPMGVFTHWVIFNLPSDARSLSEAIPQGEELASGALQGKNSLGKIGYFGPCPPSGPTHHYRFTVYALDTPLALAAGASKEQVLAAIQGKVLAQGQLIGTYQR